MTQGNRIIIAIISVVVILFGGVLFLRKDAQAPSPTQTPQETAEETESESNNINSPMPETKFLPKPELTINKSKKYTATLKTSEGDIVVELNASKTPITVNNFVYLARNKFYDGTIFHRVIDGFMIQGGDPQGNGSGGPGYRFDDEEFEGEYLRGTIAMANAGPDTNGSQFFIMHKDYPLPKNYVIFGKVTKGIEIVNKIATAETSASLGGEKSNPVNPVKVNAVEIVEQ